MGPSLTAKSVFNGSIRDIIRLVEKGSLQPFTLLPLGLNQPHPNAGCEDIATIRKLL
jgi:hypothetical protein